MSTQPASSPIAVLGPVTPEHAQILTPEALEFLAQLSTRFEDRRRERLAARVERYAAIQKGQLPDFLPETAAVRAGDWKVAPIPADLQDRRVEITGPVDRKMIINALNCGANVFMADFEDANAPTWSNCLDGQVNLRDAIRGTITFEGGGKSYKLNEKTAVLLVRPRGWHLVEKHVTVNGAPISASLFDFGLYFFHNAKALLAKGSGPYFYLPKMESHLEARLWNDVFVFAQDYCGVPQGSVRGTVLIETILGAFEMDEILYELRDHSAGLNCGRWDYIFSFIKKFRHDPAFLLPDRASVSMDKHFLASYVKLLIETCHKRGIHAMGGMAAQIPIKNDPAANEAALAKVRADKEREVNAGHDGTWVAHPGLVPIAREIFDAVMTTPNQISKQVTAGVSGADLLKVPAGDITEAGLRQNLNVGVQYVEAWLRGNGCVPIYNLMEDAATAEISRAQVWQWVHRGASLSDGRVVDMALVSATLAEEVAKIRAAIGEAAYAASKFDLAAKLFEEMIARDEFDEFLTLVAYDHID